ncbi:two-component sensor kinase yesM [Halalkalibacter hemicellulosilyticusJCM 9152]|uniref:Two-component sensor kinase yesM n=2 Tax=Halalkalibacter TaxID=2893056 RepID=W4QJS0_9BACI|nr:two-component sensor kinase yesM [Halalkalibacter hemicellulosilyticusJCM 9152]
MKTDQDVTGMIKIKEKMYEIKKAISFRQKLLLIIFVFMALPILFSMGNIIVTSLNVVKEQTIKSEEYNLELADVYFSKLVDDVIQSMNYVHFDSEIRSTLNRGLQEPIPPRAFLDINAKLDHITRNSYIRMAILPAKGEYYFSNTSFNGSFEYDQLEPWFEKLESISTYQVYRFLAKELHDAREPGHFLYQNDQVIVLGRKLTNYRGETTAYIFAGVNKIALDQLTKNLAEDRTIFLLDENGSVLYDDSDILISQPFPYLKQMDEQDSYFIIDSADDDYLLVYQPFSNGDWTIVSAMPYHTAIDELGNAFTFNVYMLTMALILLVIILLFVVNRYLQPIGNLATIAKEIDAGNLMVRSNIRRNDEIGRLSMAFDLMLDRIQDALGQVKLEQRMKRKAEMAVLQSKIKPHFIFNVLSTLRIQVLKNNDEQSADLILSFGKFLRSVYKGDESISLEKEVEHMTNYIDVINSMRQHPIKLHTHISYEAKNVIVPRFFIQPVVENACKHGIQNYSGSITITAYVKGGYVFVNVQDDGVGMDETDLNTLQSSFEYDKKQMIATYLKEPRKEFGIGLKNVYERMTLIYGDRFELHIQSKRKKGLTVLFRFPANTKMEVEDEGSSR